MKIGRKKKKKKSLCEYIDNYLANCLFKNIFWNFFFFETIFIARIDSTEAFRYEKIQISENTSR